MVFYLHNGSPILCHHASDLNSYRYICASLIENRLCTIKELSKALGVGRRNIERYVSSLRKKGPEWFFHREEKRGDCHKPDGEKLQQAGQMIDGSYTVADAARVLGVTEGALRYHIKKGTIKKKT